MQILVEIASRDLKIIAFYHPNTLIRRFLWRAWLQDGGWLRCPLSEESKQDGRQGLANLGDFQISPFKSLEVFLTKK